MQIIKNVLIFKCVPRGLLRGKAMGLIVIFLSLLFQAGCTNSFRNGNPAGAIVGAGMGAGSAAIIGAPKTAIAAAGIAGGALGYYVTTLKHDANPIEQIGGQVYQVGEFVGIELPTDEIFEENAVDIYPNANGVLDAVVTVVNRYPNHNILISGNSSGFYKPRYEQKLSQARAKQIAAYLWSHGVDEFQANSTRTRQLQYVGYGNYFKVASDLTNEGIRSNSRILITLYPNRSDLLPEKNTDVAFRNVGLLNDENIIRTYKHNYKGE